MEAALEAGDITKMNDMSSKLGTRNMAERKRREMNVNEEMNLGYEYK